MQSGNVVLFIGVLLVFLCCPAVPAQPSGPLNLDFEDGAPGRLPNHWLSPSASVLTGYSAEWSGDRPKSGAMCVLIRGEAEAQQYGFGNLMQSFSGAPFRGKRVRFRAAVRTDVPDLYGRAQLWLRVDRSSKLMGFFDNMGDRSITDSRAWNYFDIVGDIDDDAETVNIGVMLIGIGKAWVDDASFEIVGDAAKVAAEPARPLTGRGLENQIAFARLLGYVRHFHPSDAAAGADWDSIAIQGVRSVESASDAVELTRKLEELFRPIAPTVRVFPTGQPAQSASPERPSGTEGALKVIAWNHVGFGTGRAGNIYHSERATAGVADMINLDAGVRRPYRADLGGGVSCEVPLSLFADEKGTLPRGVGSHTEAIKLPAAKSKYTARDRATRLATVALAWNIFQHFYPYFDVVKTDWENALSEALQTAATDLDEVRFLNTLRRMVAALHDGHGQVRLATQGANLFSPPLAWDWIEEKLTVTFVKDTGPGPAPGDVVLAIDGKPVADILAASERLISGATPQWIRYRSVRELALGEIGTTVEVQFEPWNSLGTIRTANIRRDTPQGTIQDARPKKVEELEPGIFYLDLSRIQDSDFSDSLPRLAKAKGIVFDMRGYPGSLNAMNFLSRLSETPLTSPQWHIPNISVPDHMQMRFTRGGEWRISPASPYLKAKKAFITDGRAISYAESCMGIVEHYKLGEIVGGPTAGTNGNVNPFELPGGYSVAWTGMKVLKHDGSRHHGVGILPTKPVSRTRAGVAAGRDELLEAAILAIRPAE